MRYVFDKINVLNVIVLITHTHITFGFIAKLATDGLTFKMRLFNLFVAAFDALQH